MVRLNMGKRVLFIFLITLAMLSLLFSCSLMNNDLSGNSPQKNDNVTPMAIDIATPTVSDMAVDATTPIISDDGLKEGCIFYDEAWVNGTLEYTLASALLVSNISEQGFGSNQFDDYAHITIDDATYHMPDFVQADGSLIDGAMFVLFEISVTNVDADNNGFYQNPYIFRADTILTVVDTSCEVSPGQYEYFDVCFFNQLGQLEEHPYAYQLVPGEETTLNLGYLISVNRDNKVRDVNKLYASNSSGSKNALLITLDLERTNG